MSELDLTNIAASSILTPIAGVLAIFSDSADKRVKSKDENGVITVLNGSARALNVAQNGGFAVQQRVATAATAIPGVSLTTRNGKVADRWAVTTGNVTTTLWTQADTGGAVETGLNSKFYGKITQNTNAAKFILSQMLANQDIAHLRGQKVRLSIKLKQFVGANANYRLGLLQLTAAGTIDQPPTFISAIGGASVEPTWGANLVAISPDAIPAPENGTISGVALTIASTAGWVRSSAVFSIPLDAKNLCIVLYRDTIGAASDAVGIAEVQMTQSSDLVDYVAMPFFYEYERCRRYFVKTFPYITVPAQSLGAGGAAAGIIGKAGAVANAVHLPFRFPAMFRAVSPNPTVTTFNPSGASAECFRLDGASPAAQTATTSSQISEEWVLITATGDANGAVGDGVVVHITVDTEFST